MPAHDRPAADPAPERAVAVSAICLIQGAVYKEIDARSVARDVAAPIAAALGAFPRGAPADVVAFSGSTRWPALLLDEARKS